MKKELRRTALGKETRNASQVSSRAQGRLVRLGPPILVVGLSIGMAASMLFGPTQETYHVSGFSRLPVLNGGRIKPLDTVARTSLLVLSGKRAFTAEDRRRLNAPDWLLDMMFKAATANQYRVFQIDNTDVLGALGIRQTEQRCYSFSQLQPYLPEIEKQAGLANEVKPETRSRFQSAALDLQNKLTLYQKLQNTLQLAEADNVAGGLRHMDERLMAALTGHLKNPGRSNKILNELSQFAEQFRFIAGISEFFALPQPDDAGKLRWMTLGDAVLAHLHAEVMHPGVVAYAEMGDAYRASDPAAFNRALDDYTAWLDAHARGIMSLARYESLFNAFNPFYKSLLIYLAAFLMIFLSWLFWPVALGRYAFALMLLAFVVHTLGLGSRIILQGRPPVTNLYSSAVFVGWIAVILGIILERRFRRGIGTLVASAIGALTLIIALHLDAQGDTLEMMRAVLDSNFWLATHVTCITIGYSSTFVSGFLGCFYIFRHLLAPHQNRKLDETVEKMVYGIVCFSTFFSFLGTILGGIWADQSWGRFWGWDPKENGALMIVLWNSAVLHARWGGVITRRGLMIMAVFGNIVTGLSWFGVNMLGIGLHSYGFMDKAFVWLSAFVVSQLAIMSLGLLLPIYARD